MDDEYIDYDYASGSDNDSQKDLQEYEVEEEPEIILTPFDIPSGAVPAAYITGWDGSSYQIEAVEVKPFWTTPFDNYSVSEGLLLVLLICIWTIALVKFLGWCFKWIRY